MSWVGPQNKWNRVGLKWIIPMPFAHAQSLPLSPVHVQDWREVWLRDCFWHVLFAFILLVVMIIWRPSSNRSRFAYSLVTDEEEVVFEQGSNKNFGEDDALSMLLSCCPIYGKILACYTLCVVCGRSYQYTA